MKWVSSLIFFLVILLDPAMATASTYYVATNGLDSNPGTISDPFLTVAKGVSVAQPADKVVVGSGTYPENVSTARAGTAGSMITLDGQGVAQVKSFLVLHSYIQIQNFAVQGTANTTLVYIDRPTGHCVISNNVVDALDTPGLRLLGWNNPTTYPFGTAGSDNLVISNTFMHGNSEGGGITVYGDRNVIQGNFFRDSDTVDWLRVWGRTNTVIGNTFSNHFELTGSGHADFYQVFGPYYGAQGIVIEQNKILRMGSPYAQLCMISPADQAEIRDITFRNNLFVDVPRTGMILARDVKWLNNTFLRCGSEDSTVLSLGVGTNSTYQDWVANSAHGSQVLNNVFLDCGTLTNYGTITWDKIGWYRFDSRMTNIVADYNYVGKNSYQPVNVDVDHYVIGDPAKWNWEAWWEPHGINGGNPLFANESTANLHLLFASPLIGAATNLSAIFITDGDGNQRGTRWDIGAFQYTGTTNRLMRVTNVRVGVLIGK